MTTDFRVYINAGRQILLQIEQELGLPNAVHIQQELSLANAVHIQQAIWSRLILLYGPEDSYKIIAVDENGKQVSRERQRLLSVMTAHIPAYLKRITEGKSPMLIILQGIYKISSYNVDKATMSLDKYPDSALHEYLHRMQHIFTVINEIFLQYHLHRSKGQKLKMLKKGVWVRDGGYIDLYWGREYQGMAMELMPKAMEVVLGYNKPLFATLYMEDRELLELTMGILLEDREQWH